MLLLHTDVNTLHNVLSFLYYVFLIFTMTMYITFIYSVIMDTLANQSCTYWLAYNDKEACRCTFSFMISLFNSMMVSSLSFIIFSKEVTLLSRSDSAFLMVASLVDVLLSNEHGVLVSLTDSPSGSLCNSTIYVIFTAMPIY